MSADHVHLFLQCHLNVICMVVRVISICKVWIDMWVFSERVNHTTCQQFELYVSIDVHFIFVRVFACQVSKTWQNFVKTTHTGRGCQFQAWDLWRLCKLVHHG